MRRRSNRNTMAFTLIEMMVVISITAILVALAIPSMRDMAERNAIAGQTNSFVGAATLARSEAIKRNASVVMCRSTNADSTDTPSCAGSGTDWQSGWIVFLDRNADGQFQLAQGDVVLRVQGAFTDSGGILQNAFRRLQFRNTGLLSTGASQFTFNAVSGKPSQQRRICVLITGRVRLIDNDTDLCD